MHSILSNQRATMVVLQICILLMLSSLCPALTPDAADACLATAAANLDVALNASGWEEDKRQTLLSYGKCLGVDLSTKVVIAVPNATSLPAWMSSAQEFESLTGIQVVLDVVGNKVLMSSAILSELTSTPVHDGWIFDQSILGAAVSLKSFADLGPFLAKDADLQFGDYLPFYRQSSAVVGGKVVGLPLDGDLYLMYYRADIFQAHNLTVPQTWDDFLEIARTMNGTIDTDGDGKNDLFGACFDVLPVCKGQFLLAGVWASYSQYAGTTQGLWFDTGIVTHLQSMVDNDGMRAALQFWQDLAPYTNPTWTCNQHNHDFQAGRCLMTINWGDEFKAIRDHNVSGLGMAYAAPLPGSKVVWDRTAKALVPYSTPYINPVTGQQEGWVNRTPYAANGGWTAAVSNKTTLAQQQAAYDFLSYLASPQEMWEQLLDPESEIDPVRLQHLTDVPRWVAAGYDLVATVRYLEAIRTSLDNPNIALDSQLEFGPTTTGYRMPLEFAFLRAITRLDSGSFRDTIGALDAAYNKAIDGAVDYFEGGNVQALIQDYWNILTLPGSVYDLLAKSSSRKEGRWEPSVIAAVAVPVGAAIVLVLAVIALSVHTRKQKHRGLLGKVLAPAYNANTTLVVTDVQDSTMLFELLPSGCMSECMQIMCNSTRAVLQKHNGYEVATEGDSFIIAFHTAADAVMFCTELQSAMMTAKWPQELLAVEGCSSVQSVYVTSQEQASQCTQMYTEAMMAAMLLIHVIVIYSANTELTTLVKNEAAKVHYMLQGASLLSDEVKATTKRSTWSWLCFWRKACADSGQSPTQVEPPVDASRQTNENSDGILGQTTDAPFTDPRASGVTELIKRIYFTNTSASEQEPKDVIGVAYVTRPDRASCIDPRCTTISTAQYSSRLKEGSSHSLPLPALETAPKMLRQLLQRCWTRLGSSNSKSNGSISFSSKLLLAGLRVRCGVHSSPSKPSDITYNKELGRMQYVGSLFEGAKLMEACAQGGQVLISQSTFNVLERTSLPSDLLVLHMGKVLMSEKAQQNDVETARSSAETAHHIHTVDVDMLDPEFETAMERKTKFVMGARSNSPRCLDSMQADQGLNLFAVMHTRDAPRLIHIPEPRVLETLVYGILDAPIGNVTIGFMRMIGVSTLMAWNSEVTTTALDIFADLSYQQLRRTGGYLVEHVDGFVLVAFPSALAALQFAISIEADMRRANWPKQLLRHALAEEIAVKALVDSNNPDNKVTLLRGPRIKAGFDTGPTRCQVHATTGRMAYRGKVMNRAARICNLALSGQVLCSSSTWEGAAATAGAPAMATNFAGLCASSQGMANLKGIRERIEIMQVQSERSQRNSSAVLFG